MAKRRLCIAFIGNDEYGHLCAGNHDAYWDGRITDYDCIREIQECIKHHNHLTHVAIINIIEYEKKEA